MHKVTVFATKIPDLKDRKLVRKTGRALLFYGLKSLGLGRFDENDIKTAPGGKPYMEESPFYFNISHSKEAVICGISKIPLGVDVEKITESGEKIAKRFFHKREWEHLVSIPKENKGKEFTKLWTMKESYVKMTGDGLSLGLSSFNVLEESLSACFVLGEIFGDYVYSICETEPFGYETMIIDYSEIEND